MRRDDKSSSIFLAQLGQALKVERGVDAGLAAILAEHVLTAAPAKDCVEQAMAAARATDLNEGAADD